MRIEDNVVHRVSWKGVSLQAQFKNQLSHGTLQGVVLQGVVRRTPASAMYGCGEARVGTKPAFLGMSSRPQTVVCNPQA